MYFARTTSQNFISLFLLSQQSRLVLLAAEMF